MSSIPAAKKQFDDIVREHERIADWHQSEGRPQLAAGRLAQAETYRAILAELSRLEEENTRLQDLNAALLSVGETVPPPFSDEGGLAEENAKLRETKEAFDAASGARDAVGFLGTPAECIRFLDAELGDQKEANAKLRAERDAALEALRHCDLEFKANGFHELSHIRSIIGASLSPATDNSK